LGKTRFLFSYLNLVSCTIRSCLHVILVETEAGVINEDKLVDAIAQCLSEDVTNNYLLSSNVLNNLLSSSQHIEYLGVDNEKCRPQIYNKFPHNNDSSQTFQNMKFY
jgi:hypothetical protein